MKNIITKYIQMKKNQDVEFKTLYIYIASTQLSWSGLSQQVAGLTVLT